MINFFFATCDGAILFFGKIQQFIFLQSVSGREISGKVATLTLINVESIFEKSEEYEEVMGQLPDYTFAFEQQVDSSTYEIAV